MQEAEGLSPSPHPRGAITWRSVSLGMLATIFICSIAYYNDFAVNNTFFIGNNLPLGLVLMTFLFVVGINGPLSRWAPRFAFSTGELIVAFSMALVSCTMPSGGLMRWLPHSIIAPWWHAQASKEFRDLLVNLRVPDWLFPDLGSSDRNTWFNSPIVNGFMQRWTGIGPPPYWAWARVVLVWGVPTFAAYGAVMCLMAIVRRQWAENERLPFPLAQIQLSLLESPRPGQWFNGLMRNRVFWVGFAMIFALHMWNGGFRYFPKYIPEIPVKYNLSGVLANPPFIYADGGLKAGTLFFTVVGVTYFLNSSISFSIWAAFIAMQIYKMIEGQLSGDPTIPGMVDQRFGGIVAFALAMIWIGRQHWKLVLAQAFRGERPGEPRGRYLSYRAAFWGLVLSYAVFVGWLMLAGSDFVGAVLLATMLLLLFVITARFVAETGIVHSPALVPLYRPLHYMVMGGMTHRPSVESFYLTAIHESTHYDQRETLAVYGSHAMRLADQTLFAESSRSADQAQRKLSRRFMIVLALALVVGYVFSWAGVLGTEYKYGATLDRTQDSPINYWGTNMARWSVLDGSIAYQDGVYNLRHDPATNFGFGFGLTALLSVLRLRYVWWPFHPIGYLILQTFPGNILWFSFFAGWLCKQLVVRFGGHRLYQNARPFFVGMIVGESVAAGVWLVVSILLSQLGYLYVQVQVMPW